LLKKERFFSDLLFIKFVLNETLQSDYEKAMNAYYLGMLAGTGNVLILQISLAQKMSN